MRPVWQFALSGLLATLVIGLIGVALVRHLGTNEAIHDAKHVARLAGDGIVAPHITPAVLAGDAAALARLDAVVRRHVLRDGIARVKVWTADGRVVYSDERRLIGARYPLSEHDRDALASGEVKAAVSDLDEPENRFERDQGKLLEVYMPIRGPGGEPLLFEAYDRFSSVSASGRRLWLAFLPALLGGLLLLQLVNLPLAASLVRRLRRGQQRQEALLRRALDASQVERRAIAADLHDGVVQDLVGVSYALAAQADRLNGHGDPHTSGALAQGAATTRDSVRALRSLLIDIYPPSLQRSGLAAALDDLARVTTARGLPVTVDGADDLHLAEDTERLLFRCAQEALRNAARHADASAATIAVRAHGSHVVLDVGDDGRGFDPAELDDRPVDGHFGLCALRDLVTDAGGRFDVRSAPGPGTIVSVELRT